MGSYHTNSLIRAIEVKVRSKRNLTAQASIKSEMTQNWMFPRQHLYIRLHWHRSHL